MILWSRSKSYEISYICREPIQNQIIFYKRDHIQIGFLTMEVISKSIHISNCIILLAKCLIPTQDVLSFH